MCGSLSALVGGVLAGTLCVFGAAVSAFDAARLSCAASCPPAPDPPTAASAFVRGRIPSAPPFGTGTWISIGACACTASGAAALPPTR